MLRAALAATLALLAAAPAALAQNPDGLVQSHLKEVVVSFPEGVSLSPGAADGLAACPDDRLKLGTTGPDDCPDASKVGTAEIRSSLMPEPLVGAVHVRPSTPGELFRIALTASSDRFGVHIKLPGVVRLGPATGRVTAIFENLPQLPFDSLRLNFKGGPRAVLANPVDCGTYGVNSVFTPWSGTAPVTQSSFFEIGGAGCPRELPFDPAVSAGSVNPVAAASTPFVFRVRREDRNQELGTIAVELPEGVTAAIKGVPLCPDAQAAAGACDEGSRVGTATVGSGPGPAPLYLGGRVYLTEAYNGGQFGLAIVVPAVAGPFDLGLVVVRAAIHVDPVTARLRVVSDPLPRILKGVPLRLRDIHLAIDRPGFMRNGTSCRERAVASTIGAVQGATATRSTRFQLGDCRALRFSPRFAVALTGRRATRDTRMGLRVRVRARAGDANVRDVSFTLPPEVAFDALRRTPGLCTRAQLAERRCPARSRVGSARATTPLLDRPLTGPVYFVRGVRGDPFPKLAMLLDGQLRIDLLGSTDVRRRGLETTFGVLPDVPLTSFTLALRRGMLTPTRDLCARRPKAMLEMDGHNGRRSDRRVKVKLPCKPSPRMRLRRAAWRGGSVRVSGVLRRRARRSVSIAVRCGRRTLRAAARPRRGRFAASVPMPAYGCDSARLVVRYRGDRRLSTQVAVRTLDRP